MKLSGTIKIIYKQNKKAFIRYIVDTLDLNEELSITTGLCDEAPLVK